MSKGRKSTSGRGTRENKFSIRWTDALSREAIRRLERAVGKGPCRELQSSVREKKPEMFEESNAFTYHVF